MGRKTNYTKELIDKCINLYSQGYSALEIGAKLNLDPGTIIKHLKENGIKIRKIKITQGLIDNVCKDYQDGLNQLQVAEKNKTSAITVRRILKANNIEIRTQEMWLRKYDVNQNYFDIIDTQNKAYFLGFLYADGNVSKDNNNIQIALQARDLHILESFKKTFIIGILE